MSSLVHFRFFEYKTNTITMKKLLHFICITLLAQLVGLAVQAQPSTWQDWDSPNINAISTSNGSHSFVTDVIFEANHSVKVDYNQNNAITFPYRYAGETIHNGGYLLITILNPAASHASDIFTIEFLDGGVVQSTATMRTTLEGWNRLEMYKVQAPGKELTLSNGESISDYIPGDPDQIRIKPPQNKTGTYYVGKVFLGSGAKFSQLGYYHDRVTRKMPNNVTPPTTPSGVTSQQLADIQSIITKLEEVHGVASYTTISNVPTSDMTDMTNRYNLYNIQRISGQISGNNLMLFQGASDFQSNELKLTELMLDIATNYRNTQNSSQKNTLKDMFFDLYDFGVFIGGIPDVWSAGKPAMPAIFLMRDELTLTNRFTPELRAEFKRRIGFDRVYMNYAHFPVFYEINGVPRVSRSGETGEDLDYLRIISVALVIHAVLEDTPAKQVRDLKEVSRYYSDFALNYSPGIIDGLKPDGLMFRHWGWLDLYAVSALHYIPTVIYALSNGEFRINQGAHQRFKDQVISLDTRTLKNIIPNNLTKKGGSPVGYGGESQNDPTFIGLMAMSGTPDGSNTVDPGMAKTFLRHMNDQRISTSFSLSPLSTTIESTLIGAGHTQNGEFTGHKTYSYGAAAIHKRNGWMASVKGYSKWQYTRESGDPWVTYLGYGMLHINFDNHWLRYGLAKMTTDLASDGYDYRNYPGTTTIVFNDIQKIVNKEYKRYWSDEKFVGGVTQDQNGAFAQSIHGSTKNGLSSHYSDKSWFFFDDVVISLGSNIENTISAEKTVTTLFQDKLDNTSSDYTYYNNTTGISGLGFTKDETLSNSAWMMDSRGVGYWVPSGAKVYVNRRSQTGRDWGNNTNKTGDFAIGWIDHGNAPTDAKVYYINKIGVTPSEMSQFDSDMDGANPPFSVLKHDLKVHAVKANLLDIYSGIVYNSSADINVEDVKSVSRPCVFMVKETGIDQIKFNISDPDLDFIDHNTYAANDNWGYSQAHTVNVTLIGNWNVSGAVSGGITVSQAGGNTTLTCALKDGLTSFVNLTKGVAAQAPYGGTAHAIPGIIEAEDYDIGGEGIAYHETTAGNIGSAYRPSEGVDVQVSAAGGFNVGWTVTNEWMEYTVNVANSGDHVLKVNVASTNANAKIRVEFGGVDKTGIMNIPNTGGWQTYSDITKTVNLSSGQQIMRVYLVAGGANIQKIKFTTTFVHMRKKSGSDAFAIDSGYGPIKGDSLKIWAQDINNVNQIWEEIDRGGGYYSYKRKGTNVCIDGGNGGQNNQRVILWTCHGTNDNQLWEKIPVVSSPGYYRLVKKHVAGAQSYSLDGGGGGANGNPLKIFATSTTNANQQWKLEGAPAARIGNDIQSSQVELQNVLLVYPNPSKDKSNISVNLVIDGDVRLSVYDLNGNEVAVLSDGHKKAGSHQFTWDASKVLSGVFFVKLQTNSFVKTIKLLVEE